MDVFAEDWQRGLRYWSTCERIELLEQMQLLLTRTVLRWSGIPLTGTSVRHRAKELAAMVDWIALVGPLNWAARTLRLRTESWAGDLISAVRAGALHPPKTARWPSSPATAIPTARSWRRRWPPSSSSTFGTNHDPSLWERPEVFVPERFRDWDGDPHTLVPQGGGDVAADHRCPGEDMTNLLMKESVRQLTRSMTFDVPVQDLSVPLNRFPALPCPALPREGVLLSNVAARATEA